MNILSLFNGISGARVALDRAGIDVTNFYSSEVDKYANTITNNQYPDTIQLGCITDWKEWDIEQPDLIVFGSPCQGFSFAGKQLNFDDPRSALFFTAYDIVQHYKPKYFLMENVKMKKEYQERISELLGVEPVLINSALVSAQNRQRLYWCNWEVEQPDDKGILLKDVVEHETNRDKSKTIRVGGRGSPVGAKQNWDAVAVIKNRGELYERNEKSMRIDANYHKGADNHGQRTMIIERPCEPREFNPDSICHHTATATDIKGHGYNKRIYAESGKSPSLAASSGGNLEPKVLIEPPIAFTERRTEEAKRIRREHRAKTGKDFSPRRAKELVERTDNKMNCLTATYSTKEHNILDTELKYRKLTPLECERLQTYPDGYTEGVSNTQRYKALGNSFTVDVISHILKGIDK